MLFIGSDCEQLIYRYEHELEFHKCLDKINEMTYVSKHLAGNPFYISYLKEVNKEQDIKDISSIWIVWELYIHDLCMRPVHRKDTFTHSFYNERSYMCDCEKIY